MHPLALLYKSLLSLGKILSLIIIPPILNETALRIIDPIFLGSVTSSNAINVFLSLFSKVLYNLLDQYLPNVLFLQ